MSVPAPGPWGPTIDGGDRLRWLRRLGSALGVVSLVLVTAFGTTGFLLYQRAEANLERIDLAELEETEASEARHFLVVGSDAREGLSEQDRRELRLGDFDGQRSDTMIYVTITADRDEVSLVSLPRDLVVETDDGRIAKLTERFAGGADALIESLRDSYGLPVNHYVSVSLGGFLGVVEVLGGVTIELDEPLVDPKSGADFPAAGVYDMSPAEALSFVRSRQGAQADYERIARQQTFLRAVLRELVDTGNLTNPARLFRLVDEVSQNVTTDGRLGVAQARFLADDLRSAVLGGVPMTTLPSYATNLPASPGVRAGSYVLPYQPGVAAIRDAVAAGEPLPPRATREEAADTVVALWSGGRAASGTVVQPTLVFAGYQAGSAGPGPEALQAGTRTVVYALPGKQDEARKVAGLLGAEVRSLPSSASASTPADADVVVAVGDDASSNG